MFEPDTASLGPLDSITVLFSPNGGVEKQILSLIDSARQTIEVAAYAFDNKNIAKALVMAIRRGVNVTIVFDRSQTHGEQARIHDAVVRAGGRVRLVSPHGGIMHDKFIIVDGSALGWGSYNYTTRAENSNYENATFTSNPALATQYHENFERIFGQGKAEARGIQRPIQRGLRLLLSRFRRV